MPFISSILEKLLSNSLITSLSRCNFQFELRDFRFRVLYEGGQSGGYFLSQSEPPFFPSFRESTEIIGGRRGSH